MPDNATSESHIQNDPIEVLRARMIEQNLGADTR